MADNPWEFFTNTGNQKKDSSVVQAQAFSLTKVLGLLAPVVATAGTWAASQIKDIKFSSGEVTAIIIAVLALWAVTSAADVIARGLATSAATTASGRLHMVTFKEPVEGRLVLEDSTEPDELVTAIAVSDANPPEYLVFHEDDQSLSWESVRKVGLGKRRPKTQRTTGAKTRAQTSGKATSGRGR
jgi:hypothetical protein